MNIILGNIVSLLGCTVMVLIGFIKDKKKIMFAQCGQFSLQAVSHFILGGISGTIGCLVSIARNLVFSKVKTSPALKIAFIVLQIVLSVGAVSLNPITWIPIVSVAIFTWFIDTDNIILFKWIIIITVILWLVYDVYHLNFVMAAADVFTMATTGYSVYRIKKDIKEE